MLDLKRLREEANVIYQRLDSLLATKTDVLSAPDLRALAGRAGALHRALHTLAEVQATFEGDRETATPREMRRQSARTPQAFGEWNESPGPEDPVRHD